MTVPPKIRIALYLLTLVGTPIAVYLQAKGIIGNLEFILWGAEVSVVSTLAAFNVDTGLSSKQAERLVSAATAAAKLSLAVGQTAGSSVPKSAPAPDDPRP